MEGDNVDQEGFDANATSTSPVVDFSASPASLKKPKQPFVVSVANVVSHQLSDDGYDELATHLNETATQILAIARAISAANMNDPAAQITAANIRSAISTLVLRKPKRTIKEASRELALAAAVAAIGMAIEVGLHAGEVNHTRDLVAISILLILSVLVIYYTGE